MKIATWNVNGIRARQQQVLDLIAQEQPDVLCLQELKARQDQVPETLTGLEGYWGYWHGTGGYSGVSLQIRKHLLAAEPSFEHPSFDHETRIVQARMGDTVLACVYVPNGGKDFDAKMNFLAAMQDYAAGLRAAGQSLILCGDLNVAPTERDVHPKEQRANAIGQRPEERDALRKFMAEGLVDVGRRLDPDNDSLFTWWPPWRKMRERNIGWRIDFIVAAESWARKAHSCRVLREFGTSDHAPVIASFGD